MSESDYNPGDEVVVTLEGTAYLGRVEERFLSKSPERRTALFVCIPQRFPYRFETLKDYGAEISRNRVIAQNHVRRIVSFVRGYDDNNRNHINADSGHCSIVRVRP